MIRSIMFVFLVIFSTIVAIDMATPESAKSLTLVIEDDQIISRTITKE